MAPRNFDYPMPQEGRMAKSYLWAVEKDARELRKQLKDSDNLPGWVQSKIVTAQDRIQTVNRYMGHKIARLENDVSTAVDNPSKEMILGALVLGGLGYWLYTRRKAETRVPIDVSTLERPPPEFQPSSGQAVSKARRAAAAEASNVVDITPMVQPPAVQAPSWWAEYSAATPGPNSWSETIPVFKGMVAEDPARAQAMLSELQSEYDVRGPDALRLDQYTTLIALSAAHGIEADWPRPATLDEQIAKTNGGGEGLVTLITLAVGTGVLYYVLTRG